MTPQRQIPETLGEVMVDVFAALETVTVAVTANAAAVAGLVEALHERPTRRETGWFLATVLVVMVMVNVCALGVTGVILRNGQRQIESCIDPTGVCAKRGAKATGDAVLALQCIEVLLHGQRPAICEPERLRLEAAGVVLP